MPGYLAQYGEGEEQRERIIRWIVVSAVLLSVTGGILYFFLKNYKQESQARTFFNLLEKHDYQGAYATWGCTEAAPCRDYSFNSFMEDAGRKELPRRWPLIMVRQKPFLRLRRDPDRRFRPEQAGEALGGAAGPDHWILSLAGMPTGEIKRHWEHRPPRGGHRIIDE